MKFKQKIISSILSLSLVASNLFISNAAQQQLEAHFIDVGQGDSIYIELPDGTDILVDAGLASKGSNVVSYLKQQEKDIDIEYLIATHPDADHVGGMKEVFTELNVKNFYYPEDAESYSVIWNTVSILAGLEGCNIVDAKSGTNLNLSGVNIKFVQPSKDYSDNNDDSLVILVDYNNTEVLLTGDATSQTEKDMVNSNLISDIDT